MGPRSAEALGLVSPRSRLSFLEGKTAMAIFIDEMARRRLTLGIVKENDVEMVVGVNLDCAF